MNSQKTKHVCMVNVSEYVFGAEKSMAYLAAILNNKEFRCSLVSPGGATDLPPAIQKILPHATSASFADPPIPLAEEQYSVSPALFRKETGHHSRKWSPLDDVCLGSCVAFTDSCRLACPGCRRACVVPEDLHRSLGRANSPIQDCLGRISRSYRQVDIRCEPFIPARWNPW